MLLVLGPPNDRIAYTEQLMRQGAAGTLAVSSPVDPAGQFAAPICKAAATYPVICFHPEPFTTRGEARTLQALSQHHGWSSANVLTAQFHITSARVIVNRCYTGNLLMLDYNAHLSLTAWAHQYVYRSAAFVKAALHPDC
ncbi:YdcF family protein [Pseudarthrobacter sp. NPDC080039]|uniref:YdcF family protein n=1 Tax=Pseudarthrobacter sp. NPDC080039 TaxID=3155290 RepID=UPI00344FC5BB